MKPEAAKFPASRGRNTGKSRKGRALLPPVFFLPSPGRWAFRCLGFQPVAILDLPVKPSPIKTEDDYRAALAEIEGIFQAEPETPEGDRLDILTLLVESYEEQHYPVPPPDAAAALEYYRESRRLTIGG